MLMQVAYVKKTFDPRPTPEALDFIKAYYRDLRKDERVAEDITMREMGNLFRLARVMLVGRYSCCVKN